MAKSRGFSIYLLKNTFSPQNALKDDHNLQLLEEHGTNLPINAIIYIADTPGSPPWWKSYWGIKKILQQAQKGSLVFLPVDNNWVALTFGMTYHQLKDNCYEYDFGLKTTLNALDPEKIKSTDILQPENAKRQRVQSPTASNLNFFDIRQDETIIKKLTGAVKSEYIDLFRNVTGASSLRISSKLPPEEITSLCRKIIDIYNKTDYTESFPDIQNIVPVRDPDKIKELNQNLLTAFKIAPVDLVLSIPEIVDYSTSFKIKFNGAGRSYSEYSDVYIGAYREYLEECNITEVTDISVFNNHHMSIIDENNSIIKQFSIYKCFLYDCEINGLTYHLTEGEWYQIDTNYINKLENALNPYFLDNHSFLHHCNSKREDDYNTSVVDANLNANIICLDKKNISINGQTQIEPCDLITLLNGNVNLIHIKISTRSSNLSHLFNQGVNSIELLRMEEESRRKLKMLVNNNNFDSLIDSGNFSVTYGIITKKDQPEKSRRLPIFSRISLLRSVNTLKMMKIPCSIFFIYDNVDRKK